MSGDETRIQRVRAERFGAIVQTVAPHALVSVDRAMARRLGADGGALWEGPSPGLAVPVLTAPTEVHVAATDRCPAGCKSCYADARPDGHEPSFAEVAARLDELASMGVLAVAFGGGESGLREDLPELAAHARSLGMTPTLTTSGLGITDERARRLSVMAQVNVSYDGSGSTYVEVRGYRGAASAERAMQALRGAGVRFGVNTVLTRRSFSRLGETAARAAALGAAEIQLLRFKPAGRGRLDYLAERLSEEQIRELPERLRALVLERALGVRIDCALVPFLTGDSSIAPESLTRLGVMGCEAGRSLMAVRADGTSAPCSFWRESEPMPSGRPVGPRAAWRESSSLERARAHHAAPPMPCAECPYRAACRGGCRIVAEHLSGDWHAPDPECPRVRDYQRA